MPVYKDKNNSWYFKVCIKGRQFLRRGFFSKKEATTAAAKFLLENGKKLKQPKKEPTYIELLEEYKKHLKKELKITTYCDYVRKIDNFYSKLFKNISMSKLTYADVKNARAIIDKAKLCVKVKNRRRSFLFRFSDFLKTYYDIDFSIVKRMQIFKDYSVKIIEYKSDIVQHEDFIKIYRLCDSSFYRLAFLTFYLFGLRLGELLSLKVDVFDFEHHVFQVSRNVSFKTGLGHYVIVPP